MAELGEFGVIERINRGRTQSSAVTIGPGDDAAVLAAPDQRVVVTTDMLVAGRHFRLDWSSPRDIGRKAIAQNGADVAAMGARPSGYVVALGCPGDTALAVVDGLAAGMWAEAERSGAGIVGGDLVQSPQLVISVTALGDLGGRPPVLRSGARAGDIVAVAGRLGWSAAGMAALESAATGLDEFIELHRAPQPPYAAGISAATAGATAMSDVSDGLLADLGHIAVASGVAIDIARAAVRDERVEAAARSLDIDPDVLALSGGEDHALVATFPGGVALPGGWRAIGAVTAVGADTAPAVTVDGHEWTHGSGWQSFSG
ncbi:thiamine-phosphate kinase [Aldersonia sp. NBC_00410]|uniref:thiamine-phosphate kinase n=1 Tax=Aldersonia sp. NBC_00410 TaxID=2975954 RepID=UPI0022554C30|nr:thiamine-phosphate kinase [Aldersonia sp. NBC_00410]MCX5046143.1 thiamine-phosphate kinase [Aldersonia sp. NBC_00410]